MTGFGSGGFFGFSAPLLLAMIFNLLILGLTIFGLVVLIKWFFRRSNTDTRGTPTALEIAKQRYAKGEISKADFEEIKKNIS